MELAVTAGAVVEVAVERAGGLAVARGAADLTSGGEPVGVLCFLEELLALVAFFLEEKEEEEGWGAGPPKGSEDGEKVEAADGT